MNRHVETALTTLLTVATVLSAGILLRRELGGSETGTNRPPPPRYIEGWESLPVSASFGNAASPIRLVIFTDFECPFCRRFHETALQNFARAFPDSVRWSVVHLPGPRHRFAKPAAYAFECALRDSIASARIADVLYAQQDSFGLKSWTDMGTEAGVTDSIAFKECLRAPPSALVNSGEAAGIKAGVSGTPGIMLNGWLFSTPPSDSLLIRAATYLLANNNKFPDIAYLRQ
jgi:protein-disulfide isomerase